MNKRDLLNQTDVMQRRVTLDDLVSEMIGVDAPPTGLEVLDGGGLAVYGFTLTSTGLIAPEATTFEDWQAVGDILRRLESGMQWLIGDWYRLGEHQWGSMYEDAAVMLGYSAKTLREYAYVSRNVELSIRMDNLSFGHHQLVAAMEPDQQAGWLRWAVENGASVAGLRAAIKGKPTTLPGKSRFPANVAQESEHAARRLYRIRNVIKGTLHVTEDELRQDLHDLRAFVDWLEQML